MIYFLEINIKSISITIALFPLILCYPRTVEENNNTVTKHLRGRYVPELHGASLGKWTPDPRGLYQHINVPYIGGYGDRGEKYEHDVFQQKFPNIPFALGPQDHLRFMIDFNYDNAGWQIIKFDWIRDGEEERHYNYENENKLWDTQDIQKTQQQSVDGYDYSKHEPDYAALPDVTETPVDDTTNVHVDGEYDSNIYNVTYTEQNQQDSNIYNVTYTEQNQQPTSNDPQLQASIQEVLNYIATNIIPTLS